MAEVIKVQLIEGRDILMEDGGEWPQGVVEVEKTHYIRRRLTDGDIVEVDDKKTAGAAPSQPKSDQIKGVK